MLKFNFQKISQTPINTFRKRKEISNYLREIKNIIKEKNYNLPECFLFLPNEKLNFFQPSQNLKLIIVIGIGGSSLGSQAIFEALRRKKKLKEILFLDSLNPLFLRKIEVKLKSEKIKREEMAIFLISKSGKTFESIVNFFVFSKLIAKYQAKIFFITQKDSPLWKFGERKRHQLIEFPSNIEGRYSVLSPVHLFPLRMAGLKIDRLLKGAREANKVCLKDHPLNNPALSSALIIFYHWQKGKNIYSNIVFPPDLEYFGKWYVQLMAESVGKERKGITPIVTTGTTDFHTIGQLFFEGPRDKLINFIFVENLDYDYQLPKDKDLENLFPGTGGKKIWQLNQIIFKGVKKSYLKKRLPFTETILEKLDEENLGFLLEMKMIEIILLARLMKVNPFGQPGVELYKAETRKILKN